MSFLTSGHVSECSYASADACPLGICTFVGRRESTSDASLIRGNTAMLPSCSRTCCPKARQEIYPLLVVRLFTPDAHAIRLLASLDPADGDTAHGLINIGIGMPMLGTVKLSENL